MNNKYEYIETFDALKRLKNELSCRDKIKEIGVDLEHHDMRSYLGFTCLLQISTRYKDYIIDTIKLRSEMNILNEIFTDSTLLKVFHSPFNDIEWLQKDFGIYLVNIFDTSQANYYLKKLKGNSLSEYLMIYFNVKTNKKYQRADWRRRPLSNEMLNYARLDTHYLLNIYDNLRNELIKISPELLQLCHQKSNEQCLRTYSKPIFNPESYKRLIRGKSYSKNISLKPVDLKTLKLLFEWRDNLARELDESCEYLLENQILFQIGFNPPELIKEILSNKNISQIVKDRTQEILDLILLAKNLNQKPKYS
jgi:exosome complex exonuclease RRP6